MMPSFMFMAKSLPTAAVDGYPYRSRVKGHKEDTIIDWVEQAAKHAEAIEEVLLKDFLEHSLEWWNRNKDQIFWKVGLE